MSLLSRCPKPRRDKRNLLQRKWHKTRNLPRIKRKRHRRNTLEYGPLPEDRWLLNSPIIQVYKIYFHSIELTGTGVGRLEEGRTVDCGLWRNIYGLILLLLSNRAFYWFTVIGSETVFYSNKCYKLPDWLLPRSYCYFLPKPWDTLYVVMWSICQHCFLFIDSLTWTCEGHKSYRENIRRTHEVFKQTYSWGPVHFCRRPL